mgnify:CR=1 FL=1
MIFQGDIALGGVGQFPQHFLKIRDAAAAVGNIEIKSIGKSRDKVRERFAAQGQQCFPAAARARQGQEVKLPVTGKRVNYICGSFSGLIFPQAPSPAGRPIL